MATQPGMSTSSATSSGLSASLVTQEVELVYWKDIKESDAIEDLQGFLDKFPSGIYADLARRRLKNLGVVTPPDASKTAQIMALWPLTDGAADEKTVWLPRTTPNGTKPGNESGKEPTANAALSQLPSASVAAAASTSNVQAKAEPRATSNVPPLPTPLKKRGWLWSGVSVAMAAAGITFAMLSRPDQPPGIVMQAAAPLMPVSAAASSPAAVAAASVSKATVSSTVPQVLAPASAVISPLPAKAIRPLLAASKAANPVPVKLPARDEKQPARRDVAAQPEAAAIAPLPKAASVVVADSPNTAC